MSYLASEQPRPIEEAAQRVAERDADVEVALEAVREAKAGLQAAEAEDRLVLAAALDEGRDDPGQPNRERAERALAEAERRLGAEELRAAAAREELKKTTEQNGEKWLKGVVSALTKAEKASVGALERLRDCEARRARLRGDVLWIETLLHSGQQPPGPMTMPQNTPLVRNASGDRLQLSELLDGIGGFLAETSFEREEEDRAAWWAAANPPTWALAWLISSYVISANIDERFTNFGASGTLLYALVTGLLLASMFRRTEGSR